MAGHPEMGKDVLPHPDIATHGLPDVTCVPLGCDWLLDLSLAIAVAS